MRMVDDELNQHDHRGRHNTLHTLHDRIRLQEQEAGGDKRDSVPQPQDSHEDEVEDSTKKCQYYYKDSDWSIFSSG